MKRSINEIVADPDLRLGLERRFWPKVAKRGKLDCWLWKAKAVTSFGYGRMTAGRETHLKAHRVAYALVIGPIPDGYAVLHKCDTPACCNPAHLFLGSQFANIYDMRAKGRGSKPPLHFGANHHNAKFGSREALKIRRDKRPAWQVAAQYGVSDMTIYRIRRGETWKLLP